MLIYFPTFILRHTAFEEEMYDKQDVAIYYTQKETDSERERYKKRQRERGTEREVDICIMYILSYFLSFSLRKKKILKLICIPESFIQTFHTRFLTTQ